jgi:hypothetical protein
MFEGPFLFCNLETRFRFILSPNKVISQTTIILNPGLICLMNKALPTKNFGQVMPLNAMGSETVTLSSIFHKKS